MTVECHLVAQYGEHAQQLTQVSGERGLNMLLVQWRTLKTFEKVGITNARCLQKLAFNLAHKHNKTATKPAAAFGKLTDQGFGAVICVQSGLHGCLYHGTASMLACPHAVRQGLKPLQDPTRTL